MTEIANDLLENGGQYWSITSGEFQPDTPLDNFRIEQVAQRLKSYSPGPRNRLWALETVGYAAELCGIDLTGSSLQPASQDHAIAEDLSQITKVSGNGDSYLLDELAKKIPVFLPEAVEGAETPAIFKAIDAIIAAIPSDTAETSPSEIQKISRLMVVLRYLKENHQEAELLG